MLRLLADRYADALLDVARDTHSLPALRTETEYLADLLDASESLASMLIRADRVPGAGHRLAKTIIDNLSPSKPLGHLMERLADKKHLALLPLILSCLNEKICAMDQVTPVTVVSIRPLDDDESRKIRTQLQRLFNGTVHIEWIQDPSILGGLIIRSGNRIIDGSLKNRLLRLQKHLTNLKKEPVL